MSEYAKLAGKSDEIIAARTGRDWSEWVRTLDEVGADGLTHTEIARLVHERHGIDGWWAQSVTVGYERIKGLRDVGQRRGGAYEVSRSRTYHVPVETLFDAWADDAPRREWLTGVDHVVRTATSPRIMRLGFADSTIVAIAFATKGAAKSTVTVTHTGLADRAAADAAKIFWAARLDALGEVLARRRGQSRGSDPGP